VDQILKSKIRVNQWTRRERTFQAKRSEYMMGLDMKQHVIFWEVSVDLHCRNLIVRLWQEISKA
jgi:hypothetical protein